MLVRLKVLWFEMYILNPHPKALRALLKCSFPALQNLANFFSYFRILKATTLVGKFRKTARPMRTTLGNNHLIGVCIDDEIGIVRDDDYLAPRPCGLKPLDEVLIDRLWIKILLGLVNYQWPVVVGIDCNVQK